MYSGTVFTRAGTPKAPLPRSCWDVYHHVDGETPIGAIAERLQMSDAELFGTVRLLQTHGLIEERVLTYEAYRDGLDASSDVSTQDEADDASDRASATSHEPPSAASPGARGDGSVDTPKVGATDPSPAPETDTSLSETASSETTASEPAASEPASSGPERNLTTRELNVEDLTTEDLEQRSLHLPSLLSWLRETMSNVKDYRNAQAFILMEASDALHPLGVTDVDDLESVDRFDDPEAILALERAVRNNVNQRIPETCYQ